MGAWVVGNNIAGYLPESYTYAFAEWADAAEKLESTMLEYADADDNAAYAYTLEDTDEWEQPSMLAHVEAILTDDGPREDQGWSAVVEDNINRRIDFWITWVDDREPEDDYDA